MSVGIACGLTYVGGESGYDVDAVFVAVYVSVCSIASVEAVEDNTSEVVEESVGVGNPSNVLETDASVGVIKLTIGVDDSSAVIGSFV